MSYQLEVEKWKVTLRVTNSKSKNDKNYFELLTRKLNFFFFYCRVTNSKLKNKDTLQVTNSKLKNISLQFTDSMVKLLFFCFQVTNFRLKNKNFHFELLTDEWTFIFSLSRYEREADKWKKSRITVWMSGNPKKSILLLRFLRTSCNKQHVLGLPRHAQK